MSINDKALQILFHTLGLRPEAHKLECYRNHYVAGEGHPAQGRLKELESKGLMKQLRSPAFLAPGDTTWAATEAGKELAMREAVAREPKQTRGQRRYARWLESESPMEFGEWLKAGAGRES